MGKEDRIWNIMEHTFDCLLCGGRFDFKNSMLGEPIELSSHFHKQFKERHSDCELDDKGKALQRYNDWYREESTVNFKATAEQLHKITTAHAWHRELTYEDFRKEFDRDSYLLSFDSFEIRKIKEDSSFSIFRQMWPDDKRESLWDAVKESGAELISERDYPGTGNLLGNGVKFR